MADGEQTELAYGNGGAELTPVRPRGGFRRYAVGEAPQDAPPTLETVAGAPPEFPPEASG